MLMTNPTDKLVNIYHGQGFYTLKPGEVEDIEELFVEAAKHHGLIPAETTSKPAKKTKTLLKPRASKKKPSKPFFDISIDSVHELKALLDQNRNTVVDTIDSLSISQGDLTQLLDYEKEHKNRYEVIAIIGGKLE